MIDELMARLSRLRARFLSQAAPPAEAPEPEGGPAVRKAAPAAPAAPSPVRPLAKAPLFRWPNGTERVRAWLALFVVLFGLSAIVVGWFALGIAQTERAAAILLGVIGTVLGFYFGQRGTTRAQDLADMATRRALDRADRIEEYRSRAREAESQAEFLKRILKAAETDEDLADALDALR